MEYIRFFNEHSEYEDFTKTDEYIKPNVSYCEMEDEAHYSPYVHDYSQDYLTFRALEDGTFTFSVNDIEYSMDEGDNWATLTAGASTPTINNGNTVLLKATNLTPVSGTGIGTFSSTGRFDVEGNIFSIVSGDDYMSGATLSDYQFFGLFSGCTNLVNAKNLIIKHGVKKYSHACMFMDCTSLATAPELPEDYLAWGDYCYYAMFKNCTSLVTAPYLPAWAVADSSYRQMFMGCTSLENPPYILPCDIIDDRCYAHMFANCTSLKRAPILAQRFFGLAEAEYYAMFSGCSSLNYVECYLSYTASQSYYHTGYMFSGVSQTGTFVLMDGADVGATGHAGIPTGWNVEKRSFDPENEYLQITSNSSNVTTTAQVRFNKPGLMYSWDHGYTWHDEWADRSLIPPMETTLLKATGLTAEDSTSDTPGIGTFTLDGTSSGFNVRGNIMSLVYGDDFKGKTEIQDHQFEALFKGIKYLANAKDLILPSTELTNSCYKDMFNGCSGLTTSPDLNASTLEDNCYESMFSGCSSLKNITCLATDISATDCTKDWTNGVAASGTFVKKDSMSSWTTGVNGIPDGWSVLDDNK